MKFTDEQIDKMIDDLFDGVAPPREAGRNAAAYAIYRRLLYTARKVREAGKKLALTTIEEAE